MMLLIGAVGWGLLAVGALTHVWHHKRLRVLLGLHFDREVPIAAALTGIEVALGLLIAVALFVDVSAIDTLAIAAALLGAIFTMWILRLLISRSELPCACSFSATPTSPWSLVRSLGVVLVAALALTDAATVDSPILVATLAVGAALAAALFVLPDALEWPAASRALLARMRAHEPGPV